MRADLGKRKIAKPGEFTVERVWRFCQKLYIPTSMHRQQSRTNLFVHIYEKTDLVRACGGRYIARGVVQGKPLVRCVGQDFLCFWFRLN